jgi:hypothetical protein
MTAPTTYEIVLRGRIGTRLLQPLVDDFTIDRAQHGVTRLLGEVQDAAHLHGVVAHLTSVHIELISIGPLDANATVTFQPTTHQPTTHQPTTHHHERNPQP